MGLMSTNQQKLNSKKILEEQGLSGSQLESIGDVINFEVSIKIKDSKGTLSIVGESRWSKRMSDLMMSESIKKRKQSRQMMVVEKRLHIRSMVTI